LGRVKPLRLGWCREQRSEVARTKEPKPLNPLEIGISRGKVHDSFPGRSGGEQRVVDEEAMAPPELGRATSATAVTM
jgi:hypothetical protein